MKEVVVLIVLAAGGYFAWKHYQTEKAAEAPPAANQPAAPVANQHGENRATAFSGAAPE